MIRPFIADQTSVIVDGVREITGGRLRALIITSSDAREGWPMPEIVATTEEVASADAPRLRGLPRWL